MKPLYPFLLQFAAPEKQYHYPELFSHTIASGDKLYGMVFKPHDIQMGVKYPIILSVYGGPEVQLVSNTFKGKSVFAGSFFSQRTFQSHVWGEKPLGGHTY